MARRKRYNKNKQYDTVPRERMEYAWRGRRRLQGCAYRSGGRKKGAADVF